MDEGFVFVTEEKAQELKGCIALPGDLVFTAAGTLGQVGLIPSSSRFRRYVISNKQLRLRPDPERADGRFLYYWFSSPSMRQHIINQNRGASVPMINLGVLRALPVRLPPLHVQRTVAAVLAAYDELIENNLRRIEILEEMAQAVYRDWFINFRFPGHEDVVLVDSALGPIPEGWEANTLGQRVELAYGKALRADDRRSGDVPVLGSSGVVGWHDEGLVAGPGIIVGRKGNVGSVHWVDTGFHPIDTTFYVVSELPLHYLVYNLRRQNFINSDAAVPGLNRNQAYANPLVVPPTPVLERFVEVVEPTTRLRRNLRNQNTNLRAARDLLLPRLVSGKIDVSDLDIDTEWLAS